MNKRTTARAARLYSLALAALMDNGGAETEEEAAVVQAASDAAEAKLAAMGLTVGDVVTLQHCIALAKAREAS
ncbi:hypothetical protein [Burkholderia ubonensis]|uniref:Uncharacterized protein n=1 Tax=Burkholderia ubonensis TaxID=101571 RepID=A0ABD4DZP4_9BURK|nr:hypothetical protein [Burkholderia ubonensis]KVN83439.1 hypothetical protein WJ68_16125 [Burkholderia ubonensis]